ncbi:hypothetical protein KXS07_24385 [Inquilinus limosus]|uniref:hypothetical protein n=1 Tax=Inquilinus limosus TaxID=171674 RepID=UPI003F174B65
MFIGSGETGAAAPAVQGNGFVRHNQGQLFGGALVAVAPIGLRNPDGLGDRRPSASNRAPGC